MKTPWEHRHERMITPWEKNNMKICSITSISKETPVIRSEGSCCNCDRRTNIPKNSRFSSQSRDKEMKYSNSAYSDDSAKVCEGNNSGLQE